MWALSRWYGEKPSLASRPFSWALDEETTKWFVLWDWWWIFVLETLENAQSRWVKPLGKILWIWESNCIPISEHLPLSSGTIEWQIRSMKNALDSAWISPEEFKEKWWVVFAHWTATEAWDLTEARSIHKLFWDWIKVIATKGVTWHALGWSSGQSLALAIKSMQEWIIPWTANYSDETRMEGLPDWIKIIWENTEAEVSLALINAFWFWWHDKSLLVWKN